jgi:hypothetical protein
MRERATQDRAMAARLNYLALSPPDLAFSAKEASRRMSQLAEEDFRMLKRAARYHKPCPCTEIWYDRHEEINYVDGHTDSDWAGSRRTRKLATGAIVNSHPLKTTSKTQPNIALSSGELSKHQPKYWVSMWKEWGIETKSRIWADTSAAFGIVGRQGLGKVRLLDTNVFWIQEAALKKYLAYSNAAGQCNIADLMTKYLDNESIMKHYAALVVTFPKEASKITLSLGAMTKCPMKPPVNRLNAVGKSSTRLDAAKAARNLKIGFRMRTILVALGRSLFFKVRSRGSVRGYSIHRYICSMLNQCYRLVHKIELPPVADVVVYKQQNEQVVGLTFHGSSTINGRKRK